MSEEKTVKQKRKPKQRVFYKEDGAGLWVFLETNGETILLTPTPLRMAYADYIRERVEAE